MKSQPNPQPIDVDYLDECLLTLRTAILNQQWIDRQTFDYLQHHIKTLTILPTLRSRQPYMKRILRDSYIIALVIKYNTEQSMTLPEAYEKIGLDVEDKLKKISKTLKPLSESTIEAAYVTRKRLYKFPNDSFDDLTETMTVEELTDALVSITKRLGKTKSSENQT